MSTRANITFNYRGKELYTIPISSDGYPSGIGQDLVEMLKQTDCESIRNNRVFLKFANQFVIEERGLDYLYEVDVSGKQFKIAVLYGSKKKPEFNGNLEEFIAYVGEE
ncbi:MAG TPA: hypothetical protein PK156_33215 [Polyangium sp.]|nr:hypothetical protein [Polyangium sp.]